MSYKVGLKKTQRLHFVPKESDTEDKSFLQIPLVNIF